MENKSDFNSDENPVVPDNAQLSQEDRQRALDQMRFEQNLPMAILAGIIAALAGALLWAFITVATGYQVGYMAVAVGFMVGYAVRIMGKGIDMIFGIIGAFFSLLGCLIGNFFSLVGISANAQNLGYVEMLSLVEWASVPAIMAETFSAMDLLFYFIAIYEGFRFSFRKV